MPPRIGCVSPATRSCAAGQIILLLVTGGYSGIELGAVHKLRDRFLLIFLQQTGEKNIV